MLETLSVFERLNENLINLVVTIFHCFGQIDAGQIRLSQGDPYSLTWEEIMLKLEQEGVVGVEQKAYREYFLKAKYEKTEDFKQVLEVLKHKRFYELRDLALQCHSDLVRNHDQQTKRGIDELKSILNVQSVSSPAT